MQATILLIGDLERNLLRQAKQLSVPRGYLLDICVISDFIKGEVGTTARFKQTILWMLLSRRFLSRSCAMDWF